MQHKKYIEDFKEEDWSNVAQLVPSRDQSKCLKRWLFIQKLGGTKLQWTPEEDSLLKLIVSQTGATHWTRVSELFNGSTPHPHPRNGKQCRERWLNFLNPGGTIRKGKWTVTEDLWLLRKQRQLGGNKWSEIAREWLQWAGEDGGGRNEL